MTVYLQLHTLLSTHHTSLGQVIVDLLLQRVPARQQDSAFHSLRQGLLDSAFDILAALNNTDPRVSQWMQREETARFVRELHSLVDVKNGWHFSAVHASPDQIEDFRLDNMRAEMGRIAPRLCTLLDTLVHAGDKRSKKRDWGAADDTNESENHGIDLDALDDPDLWAEIDNLDGTAAERARRSGKGALRAVERRLETIRTIRIIVILSILMLTVNRKCNAFASVFGIFCYANNVPEIVVEALSRLGVGISSTTSNAAIKSLSSKAGDEIVDLGQSLRAIYAYDNFDMDVKTWKPTIESKSASTLHHLTSALAFAPPDSVTSNDLKCSDWLWQRSRLNDELPDDRPELAPLPEWQNVLKVHPKYKQLDSKGMSSRDRFNSWKFLYDLVHYGPTYFHRFRGDIGKPEVIDAIPLRKTRTVPLRAMEICNSTVSGNIEAVTNILEQSRLGDPEEYEADEDIKDISEHVAIFHGDLGSGERFLHGQMRRAIEESPWLRLQMVVYVHGLFHAKMAVIDAIHRILIRPESARLDPDSVLHHVAILRPHEMGKMVSKPGYRPMHQVVGYDGIARRLEILKAELLRRHHVMTLEEYAATEPTLDDLHELCDAAAMNYVARPILLEALRSQPAANRDEQYENNIIIMQLYLLYEELSYAMNDGDIGRMEKCLEACMFIFKATGKHKYATEIIRHFTNVHFFYPNGLKRAVRYSMLINRVNSV